MTKKMQFFNRPAITGIIIGVTILLIGNLINQLMFPAPDTGKIIVFKKAIELENRITALEKKTPKTSSESTKITVLSEITKLKQKLKNKNKEIEVFKKSLTSLNTDFTNKAKTIIKVKGERAALNYLQNLPQQAEAQLEETMQKWADKYRLEAQLLMIDNQYAQAKQAYKKMIDFDNSADSLFIYARFLQKQNIFNDAIAYYQQSLEKYQTLAKTNPDVYQPDVAMMLNNLAILYHNKGQNTQAEKAYDEALEIYRTLVKTNLDVCGIDLTNTLI